MTSPEMLESGRAEPDYDMQDDMSEFAVEYATELAQLGAVNREIRVLFESGIQSTDAHLRSRDDLFAARDRLKFAQLDRAAALKLAGVV